MLGDVDKLGDAHLALSIGAFPEDSDLAADELPDMPAVINFSNQVGHALNIG